MQVDAVFLLELVGQKLDEPQVKVLSAQEGIAVGRQHFKLMLTVHFGNLNNGDIKCAAAEVIDRYSAIALSLVHTVGKRRSGGFVNDPFDLKTRDAASILGCLTLRIIEVGRHSNDRFSHRLAEILLCGFLHFAQHFSGHLRRRHLVVVHLYPGVAAFGLNDLVRHHLDVFLHHVVVKATTNQSLYSEQCIRWIGDGLPLGGLTYQNFAVVGISDNRRRRSAALGVLDDSGLAALQYRYAAVGRTQVDANNLAHVCFSYRPVSVTSVLPRFLRWGHLM